MTSRERVLCALAGGTPDRVPFTEQFVAAPIPQRLLGRPDDARYLWSELAGVMDNDVVKFSRYPPLFCESGHGMVGGGLIHTRDDLAKMVFPTDEKWIDEARTFLREQRGDRAAAGGTRLGISATLLSMGLEDFSIAVYEDRELLDEIIGRYVRFAKRTTEVFCELGFDLVWCFDDFAYKTGPMFSPDILREVFLPAIAPVARAIKIPWIFHSDGNLYPVLDDLLSLGMSGLHPVEPEAMELGEFKRIVAGRACVIGNISVDLLASGSPAQVREAVRHAIATAAPGGGYMISSGNSIPAYAKLENVHALIDAVKEFR